MHILEQRFLRGPNLWSDEPCMMAVVDFGAPVARAHAEALLDRVAQLQAQAGAAAPFGQVVQVAGQPAQARIIAGYQQEKVADKALRAAMQAHIGEAELADLLDTASLGAVGTSTAAVVNAAAARGIPVLRLTEEANLFQLGWGSRQKRLQATMTSATSHIAVGVAGNKQLTKTLLEQGGIPVPKGGVARTGEEALALAERLGYPVTLKPLDGNQGKGVTTRCANGAEIGRAFAFAREYGRRVIVERFIEGQDYRVLVTGKRVAAAAWRRPPSIIGNGRATVQQLVDEENRNPQRGDGHTNILTRIALDEPALALLLAQGYHPGAVPPDGICVQLRGNANLSTGGSAEDVTDLLHPDTRAMCIRAAALIGLDVAGIDLVCGDIGQALSAQRGAVIEVNAAPGIRMHEYPSRGKARQAGAAIVDAMFGEGDGRIPVIAVTGTNGKTTTTLMIAHAIGLAGRRTGVTTTEGVFIDGERIITGDCAGFHSARSVLASNQVDVAVLETARGGILKRGLAFHRCSVSVVLNVSADHLGLDGVETVEQLAGVKAVVARRATDAVVLNADDALCVAMAAAIPASVERIYFSLDPDNPLLLRHVAGGGRALYLQDGCLVIASERRHLALLQASAMPSAYGGHAVYNISNALACAAALLGAGFSAEQARAGLSSFVCDAASNPLRSNLYDVRGVTVMVDYAHNPAPYQALGQMARSMARGRCLAVVTAPGDRRSADLHDIGRACASGFDELFAYEADPRGRERGATAKPILDGARAAGMGAAVLHAIVPVDAAFAAALARCHAGDLLLFACGCARTADALLAQHLPQDHACEKSTLTERPIDTRHSAR